MDIRSGACASITICTSVSIEAAALLDQLAERQGLTRSTMLRALVQKGLAALDFDLIADYVVASKSAPRGRKRSRMVVSKEYQVSTGDA